MTSNSGEFGIKERMTTTTKLATIKRTNVTFVHLTHASPGTQRAGNHPGIEERFSQSLVPAEVRHEKARKLPSKKEMLLSDPFLVPVIILGAL
jgi:hypothetical protein